MNAFNLRFKPFDIFIMVMCIVIIVGAMIKGKYRNEDVYYFYAFMTFLCGVIYVRASGMMDNS
jgi:hypothetical protein